MINNPSPQQIYRHFKGNLYQIISLAEHSETGEELVIYQALYGDFKVYARPLSMFQEKVDRVKYPDAKQEYRFQLWNGSADIVQAEPEKMKETEVIQEENHLPEQRTETKQYAEEASQQELNMDPLVLDFLDAGTYEKRLDILAALHHRITDDMINIMAMAVDVEVNEGELEDRYEELRRCLQLFDKFECSRLR